VLTRPRAKAALWEEVPDDAARPRADDPRLQPFVEGIAGPGAWPAKDLGGTMSLNLHLSSRAALLRIYQPFESRPRILALRTVRRHLHSQELRVGIPLPVGGAELARWHGRWAEVESFVPNQRRPATWDAYLWMFEAMGRVHRGLRGVGVPLPRPFLATYGPPGTLRRWMEVTSQAVKGHPEAESLAGETSALIAELRRQWVPAKELSIGLVHGDLRLANCVQATDGQPVYLDWGFAAYRPRIHELAYSLSWIVLRPDDSGTGESFYWAEAAELVAAYEAAVGEELSGLERRSLGPYLAAVPLYLAAISGFTNNPSVHLIGNEPFIRIAQWVLNNRPFN
jgi:Ser/Thr protein kinase RdoA (MazF antagonist)